MKLLRLVTVKISSITKQNQPRHNPSPGMLRWEGHGGWLAWQCSHTLSQLFKDSASVEDFWSSFDTLCHQGYRNTHSWWCVIGSRWTQRTMVLMTSLSWLPPTCLNHSGPQVISFFSYKLGNWDELFLYHHAKPKSKDCPSLELSTHFPRKHTWATENKFIAGVHRVLISLTYCSTMTFKP